jgi:hypothetical protein
LVERNLAKVEVASSRLVSRSRSAREGPRSRAQRAFPLYFGGMAEWSCSGLQSRVRRFDSDSRLASLSAWQNPCGRPGGEIARRKGLKIPRPKGHAGWSPAPGTNVFKGLTFNRLLKRQAILPYLAPSTQPSGLSTRLMTSARMFFV